MMMVPRVTDRYDTSRPMLDVTLSGRPTGTLAESGSDVWFAYDSEVVQDVDQDRRPRNAISLRMPVQTAPYDHTATLVYFDNLLLEADTRAEIARIKQRDPSDVAGLLGAVGAECAGAVSLWPAGTAPAAPSYRALSAADIEATFDERHGERLSQAILESQQAMSGVQRKLVLRRHDNGWNLPLGGAPSTHLIKRSSGRFDGLVANELACLRLFAALGLPVPAAEPLGAAAPWPDGSVEPRLIAITRFDRLENAVQLGATQLPAIVRLHQEDLCQITGRRPSAKYQLQGGPSFRDLATAIRRHAVTPATDLQYALLAAIANVCLGNGDAHGKNFALLTNEFGEHRLAPFYDIVSTEVYSALTPTFSMKFGHSDRSTGLSRADLDRLAKDFGVGISLVRTTIEQATTTLSAIVEDVLGGVEKDIGVESPVLRRLRALVHARTVQLETLLVR